MSQRLNAKRSLRSRIILNLISIEIEQKHAQKMSPPVESPRPPYGQILDPPIDTPGRQIKGEIGNDTGRIEGSVTLDLNRVT